MLRETRESFFFLQVKSAKASTLLNVISESREAKKPDFETKTESLKGRQYKRFEQEGFHWLMAQVSNSDETKSESVSHAEKFANCG